MDVVKIELPARLGDDLEGDGFFEFEYHLEKAVGRVLVKYNLPEDVDIQVEWK